MTVSIDQEPLRDSFVEPVLPIEDPRRPAIEWSALQQTRQAVCITDAEVDRPGPTITFVNQAYTEIFRCEADDVIGRSPRIGQGPLTNRRVLDRLREHLQAGQPVEAQAINYRWDRDAFRLRWSIDPIRRDGAVVGFVAHLRDVTAEDRMRRRLTALDTLMDRGRIASRLRSSERGGPVAAALASALRPLVSEIGTATVRIEDWQETTQIDTTVLDDCAPDHVVFPIGSFGAITLTTHPDAASLLDRLAVGELGEHAGWLLELGEPA